MVVEYCACKNTQRNVTRHPRHLFCYSVQGTVHGNIQFWVLGIMCLVCTGQCGMVKRVNVCDIEGRAFNICWRTKSKREYVVENRRGANSVMQKSTLYCLPLTVRVIK